MCPTCGRRVKPGSWLCSECARDYLRRIAGLRREILALDAVATKQARIGAPQPSPNRGHAPSPINWTAMQLRDDACDWIRHLAARIDMRYALIPLRQWRWLWDKALANRNTILSVPACAGDYRDLMELQTRIGWMLTPKAVGTENADCPACRAGLAFPRGAAWGECPNCGAALDLKRIHEQRESELMSRTFPATRALAAKWATEQTGVEVTANDLKNWIRRGKLHPMKCADGRTWRWIASELKDTASKMGRVDA
ncbi:hypothetical protein [Bifidobacterium panos]|uniref:PhnA protein n=1 Tax=Bifidobacterium panos TaxID=2675321 RepID=A0ABX1T252_9BIFI|nr:hypothetical protein [Bifidobacterium sp. DSM 109963]NMN02723.1 PhnA protein [Bifidobacterium sp. DSM 109963]